jgi:hypothetical protein
VGFGLEKLKGSECVAIVSTDQTSDAANGVLVGLKVGNDDLLESDDVAREGDEAAGPADVGGGGRLRKWRVRRMAVDEHGHGGGDAMSAAFFSDGRASSIARFAAECAPAGKDETAQSHDAVRAREGGPTAIEKPSAGWKQFTPRLERGES